MMLKQSLEHKVRQCLEFCKLEISVSVEELSTDSCPAEIWCSQNKYLPEKRSLESKYSIILVLIKNIKFPMGNYQTDSSEI